MKSRLSSTVWTLVFVNGLALLVIIGLAFHAGREAGADKSILDFASLPSGASGAVILSVLLSLAVVSAANAAVRSAISVSSKALWTSGRFIQIQVAGPRRSSLRVEQVMAMLTSGRRQSLTSP